jgi:transglutaminase-like putative cysteine protease
MKKTILLVMTIIALAAFAYAGGESETSGTTGGNQRSSSTSSNNGSRVKTARPAPERNAPAKTDDEIVNEAIAYGDCATLYEYVNRGKDKTDAKLVTSANNAIKRYTTLDTGTSKYRTDKMDAKVRRVPKELMNEIFTKPEATLPGVVTSLISGVSDQFQKAKILHDWICDNIAYDTDIYFSGRITAQDYVSVLKKKKGVCSGYTNLMNQMCELAGIESTGINGYSKGFGYSGKIGKDTDHAWNALHIGSKWYLVDVTWDAGPVEKRTFIKRYSTEWLFLDSRPFLYSHLAEEDALQFYAPVLTANDFMREAYIAGKFFQYGLSLKTEDPEYNNLIDGGFTFDLVLKNSNVSLSSELRTSNQQDVNSASWAERKGTMVTFDFDVPNTAEYKGNIFARSQNEVRLQEKIDIRTFESNWLPKAEALFDTENPKDRKITEKELELFKNSYFKVADNDSYYFAEDQFDTARNNAVLKIHKLLEFSTNWMQDVLRFNIKAASGYQGFGNGVLKYPYTFSTYNQLSNTQLISPKTGTLKAGTSETFVMSSRDYVSFAIIINGEWNHFTKNSKTGNFELTLTIPPDVDSIKISGGPARTGTHWGLVQYNVVQ